jgi:hypothetical protein
MVVLASGLLLPQSVNMKIGVFIPQMRSDLWEINLENLTFSRADMVNAYYGAAYESFLNRRSSFTLEFGSYNKTVYAQYRDYVYENGDPIYQDISLRIVPIEAGFNFYPSGHRRVLNPFIGVCAGIYAWTYQQMGDFINFTDDSINEGFAETKRIGFGFSGRAGFVYRFMANVAFGLEGKYQYLRGRLSEYFEGFEPLDMGGFSVNASLNIFFR